MANRSTPSDKIIVDPLFAIPEGAEDQFVFSREGTDLEYFDDGAEYEDSLEFDEGYDDQENITLETPRDFVIVSQKIRRAPGGQQVVDVVIETDDIAGAIKYEIQVTKI